jgi:hypothetical protein
MSQTAAVIGTMSPGKKSKGAIANAPAAPVAKAIRRRRQPEARIIVAATASMMGPLDPAGHRFCDKEEATVAPL